MTVLKNMIDRGHEQIVYCNDPKSGLKAIIAIHDTTLGPSLGGCRMWNYASEEEALIDVLRLSKGMTYKAAIAGLSLGGGKSVIIADAKKDKKQELFESFGEFVNDLNGNFQNTYNDLLKFNDLSLKYFKTLVSRSYDATKPVATFPLSGVTVRVCLISSPIR